MTSNSPRATQPAKAAPEAKPAPVQAGAGTSREVPEWIGRTPDTKVPPHVRARVFLRFSGICRECGVKIFAKRWVCDHRIALINGGENRENNLGPIHETCDRKIKTPRDVREKSKIDRMRKKHLGIKKPRTIRAWRKFDKSPVYASRER